MEDHTIIELFFARSEEAIAHTREKYGALCTWIARNMLSCPEDVEECINDTLLALWNAIPPAKPQLLGPYAARVTRNLARNRLTYNTAQKRREEMCLSLQELEVCLASAADVEQEVIAKELTGSVESFLKSIDAESRNIFLRRYWFYDSIEQIAAGFGISRSKVKMRLLRTRNLLRKHLIREGYLDE